MRAILFDFNGVLLDDEPIHSELLLEILAAEGVQVSETTYWARYVGLDDRQAFRRAFVDNALDLSDRRCAALVECKAERYAERVAAAGYPFFDGARELVEEAAAAGWLLGIVSGALRAEIEAALGSAGLGEGLFEVLVSAQDVAASKPDPEGYLQGFAGLAARAPGLEPSRVLAIEDTPTGLEAARAAGLRRLAVAHTVPAAALEPLAEHTLRRLAGLGVARLGALFADETSA